MTITRDAFLSRKPKTATVEIEDLGGTITVRELSTAEMSEFVKLDDDEKASRVYLLTKCTLDDKGAPIFTDEDAAGLAEMPISLSAPITTKALTLSGRKWTPAEKKPGEKPSETTLIG